jgi:hypothetical protein
MKIIHPTLNHYKTQSNHFTRGKGHIIIFVVISSFGPYLSKDIGIRPDHIIIYTVFLWSLVKISLRPSLFKINKTILMLLCFLFSVTLWTLLVTLLHDPRVTTSKIIASAENYIQPIALILLLVVATFQKSMKDRLKILEQACFAVCVLLCINTLISIAEIFIDTWPFVQYFIRAETLSDFSVWRNAVSMGRYSGIFNQPLEAGIGYTIGLGAWLYIFEKKRQLDTFKLILLSGLLIGGSLSVSKIFVICGIPLAMVYFIFIGGFQNIFKLHFLTKITIFLGCTLPIAIALMKFWDGSEYFLRLFNIDFSSGDNLIYFYTAGRFGTEHTTVKDLFSQTIREAPIHGFGFGAFSPLDNGYLEFFYQGGLVGLIFYMAILLVMVQHIFQVYKRSPNECRLLAFLLIIVIGGGMGAPVLTINRSSIFLWVLIVLTVSISSYAKTNFYSNQLNK